MRYRLVLTGLLLLVLNSLAPHTHAQTIVAADFFTAAVPLARDTQRATGVPASVTLAQAILETGWGGSPIGEANNYFGIKARVNADGSLDRGRVAVGVVYAWTKEWDGKQFVDAREPFRQYRTMADSFLDHAYLLSENPRYQDAMKAIDFPDEFAHRIAAAGYATSPTYADDLIALMSKYDLYRYDVPRDDAQVLNRPPFVLAAPGEPVTLVLVWNNSGYGTWSPGEFALENTNATAWGSMSRFSVDAPVAPRSAYTFTLHLTAPAQAGVYQTRWVLRHGGQSFGTEMAIPVIVEQAGANQWTLAGLVLAIALGGAYAWRRRASLSRTLRGYIGARGRRTG